MQRRDFITSSGLALTAAAAGAPMSLSEPLSQTTAASSGTDRPAGGEFYELRRYHLTSGPQTELTEHYFGSALIPALSRLSFSPIGAFRLDVGPETPAFYLLIPGHSPDALAGMHRQLEQDEIFLKAAEPFWSAPATAPSFVRVESSLLAAFEGWPKLTPPPSGKRIFQLRTYESPSPRDHVRKVEMFHHGEFDIFRNAGFHQVFYGSTLVGPRMPNLTYMLSFPDQSTLDACWEKFRNDPAWRKLSTDPRYAFEQIVSNVTNLILSPLSCSQI